jgi:hypothetical protein
MARSRHHHPRAGAALARRQSDERAQGGLRRLRAVTPAGLSVAVASGVSEVRIGLAAGGRWKKFRYSVGVQRARAGFVIPPDYLPGRCRRKRGKARQVDGAPATFGALLMAIGLVALWGSGAEAARITFEPSNQSITFTGNEANSVTVSSPTLSGSAVDTPNGA